MPHPYRIVLAKEDFKFSVAHFTIFGPGDAEPLHGHNYRVEVELSGGPLDDHGLLVDVAPVKKVIRALCAELDSRLLLPSESPLLAVERPDGPGDGLVVARFGERRYEFPASEVRLLPLVNVTLELLGGWFWERLAGELPAARRPFLRHLAVTVEESAGQRCRYAAPLPEVR
jgi:6-pyruvoyltetrahydropterin/6-carboxytetrahydropterin synthase